MFSKGQSGSDIVVAARWLSAAIVVSTLVGTGGLALGRSERSASGEPTLVPVRVEDGRYTDKYCIIGPDGAVIECSKVDGNLTIYAKDEAPFIRKTPASR